MRGQPQVPSLIPCMRVRAIAGADLIIAVAYAILIADETHVIHVSQGVTQAHPTSQPSHLHRVCA